MEQNDYQNFESIQAAFDKMLLLEDRGVIRVVLATVLGNQLNLDPLWLMLVASSSGGKSEIITSLNTIVNKNNNRIIFPISDITPNTFASGQKKIGKETSLLFKMEFGSIMAFKDFTSMISKNPEARQEIMGQLREIFDREYTKRTGTGDDVIWRGKVGAIAGCTEIIYEYQENLSAMGDRFLMYTIKQPQNTREVSKRMLNNQVDMDERRLEIREAVKTFISTILVNIDLSKFVLSEEYKEKLLDIADFATKVRSGVIQDRKTKNIEFVPSREMPTRFVGQLYGYATSFLIMDSVSSVPAIRARAQSGKLSAEDMDILHKMCFDSIPIKRRMALKALTKYKGGVTTGGMAASIGYQTEVVKGWLAQLNGLGVCKREKKSGSGGDMWSLNPYYREMMLKFENIEVVEGALESEDDVDDEDWGAFGSSKPKEGENESLDVQDESTAL